MAAATKEKPQAKPRALPAAPPEASGVPVHCAHDAIVDATTLVPHPRNANTHGDRQIALLAKIIRHQGWRNPITVSNRSGFIVAGHGRLDAANLLLVEDVPVDYQDFDTEAAEVAHLTADNRIAELAEIDPAILRGDLDFLEGEDFDLELAGFDQLGLDDFTAEHGDDTEIVEDEVPEPPEVPITKPGDLWQLGRHRVLCGDSTKADDVARLMDGKNVGMCFTSPPYGQQRDYTAESDCSDWGALMNGVFANLPMAEDGQVLVNLGLIHKDGEWVPYWDNWIQWMRGQGWRRFGWYVWDQGAGMPGDWNGRLAPSHEFIWHFNQQTVAATKSRPCKMAGQKHSSGKGMRGKDGEVKPRSAGRDAIQSHAVHDSIFRANRQQSIADAGGHPAPYPVRLPAVALESWPGDVYDPFLGSGTTLIAAEQLDRTCYGMEISPAYCDVIVQRWENLTGQKATRTNGS